MVWPLIAAAAGSIIGGIISSRGAQKAADTQAEASQAALDLQREIYTQNRADLAPWRETGGNALAQLYGEVGGGFRESPGYQFALEQGQRGVNNAFAASGLFNSGARAKELLRFGTGLADQEYGNYLNRLAAVANVGQTATGTGVAAGQSFATGASNALTDAGAARASGYVGQANAWGNALQGLGYAAGQYLGPQQPAAPGYPAPYTMNWG